MAKKPLFKFLPLVFLLHLAALADFPRWIMPMNYTSRNGNVFMHPFTLTSNIRDIYLTIQVPLNEGGDYHLIINPSISGTKSDYFRGGSGIGFRKIISEAETFYLQLMPSAFYLEDWAQSNGTISGPLVNVLAYIGVNFVDFYFDAGIGYGWAFLPKGARKYSDFPYHVEKNQGLVIDINFGFTIAWVPGNIP
jgi:hypothetical protein